jgi:uncharacterized protein (DUF1800 family)
MLPKRQEALKHMKTSFFRLKTLTAIVLMSAFAVPDIALAAGGRVAVRPLTEDQKILHVLNRLGFGARPGDVERVRSIGLQKYIDQQINGVSIDDRVAETKVNSLEVFRLSTSEVFAKYPNPAALLLQLDGGRQAQARQPAANRGAENMPAVEQPQQTEMTAGQQRERRQRLQRLYREYDLRPANELIPQIAANRVLRAVYSERQLQEVMVDFWQNHFNVFSGKAAVRWYIPSYERDVLRKNALGNFRDLVAGTAQHPAMLFFLDNFESRAPGAQPAGALERQLQNGKLDPRMRERMKQRQGLTDAQLDERVARAREAGERQRNRGLNENYARELMELHTLGVDGGYTQKDIVEVARAFTGWTIAAGEADLMLAVGTTLQVYPVAGTVEVAKRAGARVVILNNQPTPLDDIADLVLRAPIGEVLPAVCGD